MKSENCSSISGEFIEEGQLYNQGNYLWRIWNNNSQDMISVGEANQQHFSRVRRAAKGECSSFIFDMFPL